MNSSSFFFFFHKSKKASSQGVTQTTFLCFRNRKATLSFSPHTKAFERTPIRGTPIRGMSLTGQQKTERVAEVLATLQRLEEALKNETV